MPITIGNGFLKSEILTNSQRIRKKHGGKFYGKKIKDFFFSTGKAKADRCLHEMLFAERAPHESGLQRFF